MARRGWLVGMAIAGLWLGGYAPSLFQGALWAQTSPSDQTQDSLERAATLNRRVIELYRAGRYQEAIPLAEEVLAIRQEQLGQNHPDVAQSLNNLAELYKAQGRYSEAEPLHQESLTIRREQLGDRHPSVATSLNNLAGLYRLQGRYGEAEPRYQESLAILREQLGDRHPDVATSLNNLAGLYQAQGDMAQTVRFFQEGLDVEEWNFEVNLATLTDAQRQSYGATLSGTTNQAVSFSLEAPEAQLLGITTLLRRKGRLLDAGSNSLRRLRQNLRPEDQVVLDELVTVRQQLATLTFNPPANLPPEQYQQQLTALETDASDLEKTLAQRSALFRAEAQPIEIEAVQTQIPANGVLVEYVRYQPFDASNSQNPWGTPRYAAYLIFPNGTIQAIDLGPAAEIDLAIESFTRLLQDPAADLQRTNASPAIRPDVVERVTENIKTLVFDPLAPHLQDVDHLLISPDSQLNRLPFEALQSEAGGDYLVQRYQISYLSSGRDLLKFGLVGPSTQPAVILANPDYETATLRLRSGFIPEESETEQSLSQNGNGRALSGVEGQGFVDLAHERLMEGWERFAGWRQADRDRRRLMQRVRDAEQEWRGKGQDERYLLQGGLLAEVRDQWAVLEGSIAAETQRFYQRSDEQEVKQVAFLERVIAKAELRAQALKVMNLVNVRPHEAAALAIQNTGSSDRRMQGKVITPVYSGLKKIFNTTRESGRLQGHSAAVRSVAFSPDRQTLASSSDDQTVRLCVLSCKPIG